jgi:transposase
VVLDAILYIASSGCQWRMLVGDFPPVSTVRLLLCLAQSVFGRRDVEARFMPSALSHHIVSDRRGVKRWLEY